jgi:hypothetical protein
MGAAMKKAIVFGIGAVMVWAAAQAMPFIQWLFDFVDWLMK